MGVGWREYASAGATTQIESDELPLSLTIRAADLVVSHRPAEGEHARAASCLRYAPKRSVTQRYFRCRGPVSESCGAASFASARESAAPTASAVAPTSGTTTG